MFKTNPIILYKPLFLILFFLFSTTNFDAVGQAKKGVEFYQIKVYHCQSNVQINVTEQFLKSNYLPALHKMGLINIGVFKPIENDTMVDKRIYVFVSFKSLQQFISLDESIAASTINTAYWDAVHNNPPYQRIETILLKAFKNAPNFMFPKLNGTTKEKVYELRSYEGATEKLYRKKVQMFNEGNEISIFTNLHFNAIFYAEVLAGSKMPNLMYMTSFNSMIEREEHWKKFSEDVVWKRISALPEYQNTVSKADIILMRATDFSDF